MLSIDGIGISALFDLWPFADTLDIADKVQVYQEDPSSLTLSLGRLCGALTASSKVQDDSIADLMAFFKFECKVRTVQL